MAQRARYICWSLLRQRAPTPLRRRGTRRMTFTPPTLRPNSLPSRSARTSLKENALMLWASGRLAAALRCSRKVGAEMTDPPRQGGDHISRFAIVNLVDVEDSVGGRAPGIEGRLR